MYRNENENYDIFLSSAPDVRPENYDTFPYYDLLVCRIKGVKCDKITFSFRDYWYRQTLSSPARARVLLL